MVVKKVIRVRPKVEENEGKILEVTKNLSLHQ